MNNRATVLLRVGLVVATCLRARGLPAESAVFPLFPSDVSLLSAAQQDLSLGWPPAFFLAEPRQSPEELPLELSATLRASLSGDCPAVDPVGALPVEPRRRPLLSGRTLGVSLGVLGAVPIVGELAWWKEGHSGGFHFNNEGWFGRDTYAGGADKASHFFAAYMTARELTKRYERFGNSPKPSRALAVGVTALGGALIELGDGYTQHYGYSWTDVVSNVAGALAAAGISAAGVDDLVGFRFGYVSARIPPLANRASGYGHDYSEDVYSADFKLAGALQRMGRRQGVGRFLLVSLTYGSKGYRFSPMDVRERNIGVDLGLNMPEILLAIGVPRTRWWGETMLMIFEYIRVPYTAYGFQYDLNRRRWHGPSTGDRFDPGKLIYQ